LIKKIIIYRYHGHFELNRHRIRLLKKVEPGIPVYGIYGGEAGFFQQANRKLGALLHDNYCLKVGDRYWKWLHADLTYKMWYRDVGRYVHFDRAYVVEWDLVIFRKLHSLFPQAHNGNILCTGLIPLEKVSRYWYWMNTTNRARVEDFFNRVHKYYNRPFVKYASLGPGLSAPKSFFDGLTRLKIFEADITDEIKIPVWSQLLGLKPESNDLYRKWFSYHEMRFFNANITPIRLRTIGRELKKKNGRRAFHPFVEPETYETLAAMHEKMANPHGPEKPRQPVGIVSPYMYKINCRLMEREKQIKTEP
jgi:hypothetical protein